MQIQEEQLLAATAQGSAATRPELVTLLPRWREEALRQYEQRLHAQLAAKEARAECERQRAAARAEVQAAHEAAAVRLRSHAPGALGHSLSPVRIQQGPGPKVPKSGDSGVCSSGRPAWRSCVHLCAGRRAHSTRSGAAEPPRA